MQVASFTLRTTGLCINVNVSLSLRALRLQSASIVEKAKDTLVSMRLYALIRNNLLAAVQQSSA